MSLVYALAEALRQLDGAGHHAASEVVLQRSSREVLECLVALPHYLPSARTRFAVDDLLRLGHSPAAERAVPIMVTLEALLNRWCMEGRRQSIRMVLRELDSTELDRLGGMDALMDEVVSMTREFRG